MLTSVTLLVLFNVNKAEGSIETVFIAVTEPALAPSGLSPVTVTTLITFPLAVTLLFASTLPFLLISFNVTT
ncbi:hypothetical protein D3C80_1753310 [compost metagenome]